jgi:tetratricopeptide (TPR) repeat protein
MIMKLKKTIIITFLFSLSFSFTCLTQENQLLPQSIDASVSIESSPLNKQIATFWFQRKGYLQQGNTELAKETKERILDYLRNKHITSFPALSASFLAEGLDYLDKGNLEYAINSLKAATQMDPYSSSAQYYLAKAYITQSKGNFFKYVFYSFKGLIAPFRHYKYFYIAQTQLIKLIFISLSLSIALFIFITFINYQSLLRHDLEEILSPKIGSLWGKFTPWIIILLPLLITLGIFWILLYWVVISWVYLLKREKALVSLFLLFIFISFPLLMLNKALLNTVKSSTISVIQTSLANVHDFEAIDELKKIINKNPFDSDSKFLLASQLKKAGYMEEAFDYYNYIIKTDSNFHKAYNNKANIYFSFGEYRLAVENYKKAISINPKEAIYHYNLSLAYSEMLQYENAYEAMNKAEQIDKQLVLNLRKQSKTSAIPAVLEKRVLKRKLNNELKRLLWQTISENTTMKLNPIIALFINPLSLAALVVFIIIITLGHYYKEKRLAQFCDRCGKAFCYRCRIGFSPSRSCSQCEHIFIKQDGLLPEVKKAKISQIKNYQLRKKIQKWLFTLILPGTGSQLEHQVISGYIINFLWLFAIIIFLYYRDLYNYQIFSQMSNLAFPQIFALAGLAVVYLIAIIRAWK